MIAYTLGAIAYVVMITMLVYRLVAVRDRKKWKKLTLFSLFIALGVLLFTYEGASPIVVVQLILGMLIFNGMIPTYGSDINFVYIAFGIVYILVSYVMGLTLIAQAMLLGMLSEVAMMRDLKERIGNRRTEVRRDAVQMAAGAAIILLFYFLNINLASVVLLFIIMAGIFLVNMAKERKSERISKLVYGLERRNTALGLGALWLALGVLIAISFLGKPYIIVVFAALFIGDSAATIVGVTYSGPKLPYNSHKSIAGSFVYFLATFAISFPIIGWLALPAAALAAFVESLPWKLDDNFAVSLALVAAFLAMALI